MKNLKGQLKLVNGVDKNEVTIYHVCITSSNGQIKYTSETYYSKSNAVKAMRLDSTRYGIPIKSA